MISVDDCVALRLARQHLLARAQRRRLVAVVRDLVGVQAQLPSAAVLSLWARVDGLRLGDVDALLRSRRILRTWCIRGTAHLVAREDHGWVTRATTRAGGIGRALARRGLSGAKLDEVRRAVLDALAEGPLTRGELRAALADRVPQAGNLINSWGGVIRLFSQEGAIVFGPARGGETTFARADRWLPGGSAPPSEDDALALLFRRYLRTHAPATQTDFTYWSGLGAAEAKRALELVAAEIERIQVGGLSMLCLRTDLAALGTLDAGTSVRLLPHFDTLLLAHRDKSLLLDPRRRAAIFRAAGWVSPTIVVGGRVRGTWSHELRGATLRLAFEPFGSLDRRTRRALRDEAESLAGFLGAKSMRVSG